MLVLALDTSIAGRVGGARRVCVRRRRGARGEHVVGRRAAARRAAGPGRADACSSGRPARDLGAVVVGLGPGPFTGLRVGLVTAATMADALGVPAYGVCSLDAVGERRAGLVVTDARRREVYWARYDGGARVDGPAVERPADARRAARTGCGRPAGRRGRGAARAASPAARWTRARRYPSAPALVRLAAGRSLGGAPSEALTPLYLRRPRRRARRGDERVKRGERRWA